MYFIKRIIIGVQGVPGKYDYPPWRLPVSHSAASIVNPIIDFSMKVTNAVYFFVRIRVDIAQVRTRLLKISDRDLIRMNIFSSISTSNLL